MSQSLLYLARWVLGALLMTGISTQLLAAPMIENTVPVSSGMATAHIALAVVTSLAFIAAFVLALLLWVQTRRLHDIRGSSVQASWLDRLPAVLKLEQILFAVLWVGFTLLTILVASGMFFGEYVWGRPLMLNHKVLLTLLAWGLFGVLLIGRKLAGWRGLTAVRATIFGFALLFLAYAGTHFVLGVVLQR